MKLTLMVVDGYYVGMIEDQGLGLDARVEVNRIRCDLRLGVR